MNIQYVIAKNTEDDFQGFKKLDREFSRFYDELGIGDQYGRIPCDQLGEDAFRPEFEEYLEEGKFFMFAKDGNEYIGYTAAHIETMPVDYKTRIVGKGDALFVSPKYKGMGIGKQLLKKRIEWCRSKGAAFHQFTVKSKNPKALEFFQKQGFEVDEVRVWKEI